MRVRAIRPRWRVTAPLSLILAAALLSGCGDDGPSASAPPQSAAPVSVTNCGTPVEFAQPPKRAVTMNQAATEIMLALGLSDRMVGTAYLDDQVLPEYADAYAKVPVLAKEYPAKEKLLEAEPDFVYASYSSAFSDEGVGDRADLGGVGVGTYISPAGCPAGSQPAALTVDDVFAEIREIGAIFGVADRATALIDDHKARIAAAAGTVANAKDIQVLWWDGGTDAPSVGACCGSPSMIMSAVGVTNDFADLKGSWTQTGWETVVDRDPDVIVLVDASWDPAAGKKAFLAGNAALKDLPAVTGQRYVTIPFSSTSAGVRIVLGVEALAKGVAALPAKASS